MLDVSIVLPSFHGAHVARRTVDALRPALSNAGHSWEVLIVDDGGGDYPSAEWDGDPQVRVLRLPQNRGKGAAVRHGMQSARGTVRLFTDIDLPFGVDPLMEMISILQHSAVHVAIGDRSLPASSYRVQLGLVRRAASLAFTAFVGTIVTGGFYDTQCGLKGMRGDVADAMFQVLRVDRFAFDVELVYVALKHQLQIARIPVRLLHNETSSVRLLRDSVRGFVDVFRIRYHFTRGWYVSPALQDIAREGAPSPDSAQARSSATSGARATASHAFATWK